MIWAQVSDGTETKGMAFSVIPRQGEQLQAAISTPDERRHRVITVLHTPQLGPTILVARMEDDCDDN